MNDHTERRITESEVTHVVQISDGGDGNHLFGLYTTREEADEAAERFRSKGCQQVRVRSVLAEDQPTGGRDE